MSINLQGLQSIYQKCFVESFTLSDTVPAVQEKINDLFVIKDENREQAIIDKIKEIRKLLKKEDASSTENPTLLRLNLLSKSVKNAEAFWRTFSSTIPFETSESIQQIYVKRIKPLQDELKKFGIANQTDVGNFLEQFDLAGTLKNPSGPVNSTPTQDTSYFKPGAPIDIRNTAIQDYSGTTVPENIYSEGEIDKLHPEVAHQVRGIRDALCAKAKNGELVEEKIIVLRNPLSLLPSITLTHYDQIIDGPMYPYGVTMNSLLYNEIKEGNIQNEGQAINFVLRVLQEHPAFKSYFTSLSEKDQQSFLMHMLQGLRQFGDAHAALVGKNV